MSIFAVKFRDLRFGDLTPKLTLCTLRFNLSGTYMKHTDLTGGDYNVSHYPAHTKPAVCEAACNADAKCKVRALPYLSHSVCETHTYMYTEKWNDFLPSH